MNVFDQMAQRYDSPKQLKLAERITKEIQIELGNTDAKVGLDYGCGTGLIGLTIADQFENMILIDPSEAMIQVVDQKIEQTKQKNVKTIVGSFSKEETLNLKVDLIIVSLVMLHVPDTLDLLATLYQAVNPNGRILIVDFDKNEKIHHEKVHNGFTQSELRQQFEEIGFKSISSRTFYHGEQLFMNQDASIFILSAQK